MNTIIKRTKVRHTILIFLFLATVFNYADRATLITSTINGLPYR